MASRKKTKQSSAGKSAAKKASSRARRAKPGRRIEEAIAAEAYKLVKPGLRLFLGTGLIEPILAGRLNDSQNIAVVTPSLDVADALRLDDSIQTVLLGGVIQPGGRAATGMLAEKAIESLTADIAFQTVDAVALDGSLYVNAPEIGRINQKLSAHAERSYWLVRSCDIGRTALIRFDSLAGSGALITDDGIDLEHLSQLQHIGIEVIVAKPEV